MRLEDLKGRRLGRYEVLEVLGRGGMAAVYRARDTVLRRDVALKVLYPQYSGDVALVERFQREAVLAAGLDHPNILPIYDVGDADGLVYIAMRLLSGQSFADMLRREGAIEPVRLLPIIDQVAAALDYAHARQIVHRDIKPANILVEGDDLGQPQVRAILTDFGIAKSLDSAASGLTATGVLIGTPEYMAPEQIRGGHHVDGRADIYALGVLVYRALTGRRPFEGSTEEVLIGHLHGTFEPPSALNPTLPPALDSVMQRVLARDPAQRYQSAGEFARALRSVTGLELPTPPPARRILSDGRVVVPSVAVGEFVGHNATTVPQATLKGNAAPPANPAAPRPQEFAAERARPTAPRHEGGGSTLAWVLLGLVLALMIGGGVLYASNKLQAGNAVALPTSQPAEPPTTLPPTLVPTASATAVATSAPAAEPSAVPAPTQIIAPSAVPSRAPTKVPAPTKIPTKVPPSPTPTTEPSPEPTAVPPTETPTTPPCPTAIAAEFEPMLAKRTNVNDRLGCAAQPRQERAIAEQSFEHGSMLWVAGTQGSNGTIYVIIHGTAKDTWQTFEDTWQEGDPEDSGDKTPPAGLIEPVRGFGRVWYGNPDIADTLGWATNTETPTNGVVQRFANGRLVYSPLGFGNGAAIYVLYQDGMFERYPG
ncbi:MAG TPA: protein kinase [Kouleothrix sp.]|nr:protein kinase [Kouleothrix sp.]